MKRGGAGAGRVAIADLPAAFRPLLKPLDHSGDGVLTVAEFKAAMERYDHSTGNKSVFPLDAFPDALQRLMRPLDLDRPVVILHRTFVD